MQMRGRWSPLAPSLRFAVALSLLTGLALALRAWGLPGQVLFGDDQAVGISALNFVERGRFGPTMWHHPHFSDLLVYVAVAALGTGKMGLVLWSLVFGVAAVPLLGLLARAMTGSAAVGLLAAFLLAIDPLHVDFSRQAVREDWMLFFTLAGLLLLVRHQRTRGVGSLVGAGIAFGVGVACKWYVAFPCIVVLALLVADAFRGDPVRRRGRAALAACRLAALTVLPAAVYLATFAPWFARGHDLAEFIALQRALATEQAVHAGFNAYGWIEDHRPGLWFLRPTFFADFAVGRGEPVVLLAITNPIVWLATLPAMAWLLRVGWRERSERSLAVVALFVATYLPFVLVPRPVWVHSAFAALPFALTAVAWGVVRVAQARPRPARWLAAYVAAASLAAVPLYLLAIGEGLRVGPLRSVVERVRPPPEMER